jgi:hypothetical protein
MLMMVGITQHIHDFRIAELDLMDHRSTSLAGLPTADTVADDSDNRQQHNSQQQQQQQQQQQHLRSVNGTTEMSNSNIHQQSEFHGTVLLYEVSESSSYQTSRINQLSSVLKDNLVLVWGGEGPCPYRHDHHCIDDYPISTKKLFSHRCCSQEMAVLWAMNQRNIDYAWFMEDDVVIEPISELQTLLSIPNKADWFNQAKANGTENEKWMWTPSLLKDMRPLGYQDEDLHRAPQNFFRLSRRFLNHLEEAYDTLGQQFAFFEGFLPTLAIQSNLTLASWVSEMERLHPQSEYYMKIRPCKTEFPRPGIFHPVKVNAEDLTLWDCDAEKNATNISFPFLVYDPQQHLTVG